MSYFDDDKLTPTLTRCEARAALQGLKILVVEDDSISCDLLDLLFQQYGIEPVMTSDVQEALEAFQAAMLKSPLRFVLTSYRKSGRELIATLGALPHKPQIILMSSMSIEKILSEGELQFDTYINKKVLLRDIIPALVTLLKQPAASSQETGAYLP